MTPRIRNGGRPLSCAASKGCPQAGDGVRVSSSRGVAVTSPQLALYMALFRLIQRRSLAKGPPQVSRTPTRRYVLKGRHRADDAARIRDCLYHCADSRADRAVFHRLESVPAAIRD